MKVLVIDDEEDVRRIAWLSLVKVGKCEVVEASNGNEGVAKARSERPDVILLDVMMPGLDGPATLRLLRDDPATAAIDVVFVTARALSAEVRELEGIGARGVLTKPFNALTLPDDLRRVLGEKR